MIIIIVGGWNEKHMFIITPEKCKFSSYVIWEWSDLDFIHKIEENMTLVEAKERRMGEKKSKLFNKEDWRVVKEIEFYHPKKIREEKKLSRPMPLWDAGKFIIVPFMNRFRLSQEVFP